MKVRIDYTVEVDDSFRIAINRFYGQPGMASRAEVKAWFERYGSSMDDDLTSSMARMGSYSNRGRPHE